MMILPDAVVLATGCPRANVLAHWPTLYTALERAGADALPSQVGAIATVAVETGRFVPTPEYDSGAAYEGRLDLGNSHPGDGMRYKGRGFIQLTGRANYREYGRKLGLDLETDPDKALDAKVAAAVFALYWTAKRVPEACAAGDWHRVRRLVNGGLNGWDRFHSVVTALGEA